jgi:hypothetical protein
LEGCYANPININPAKIINSKVTCNAEVLIKFNIYPLGKLFTPGNSTVLGIL